MMTTEAPVISVMTVNPITITPDTKLERVRELLKQHRIRHLPVLGDNKSLVGIVSVTDLAMLDRLEAEGVDTNGQLATAGLTAADLMTRDVIGLAPDDTIGLAADLFLSRELHAAPVLDDGELIGIVTSHDLLRRVFADVLPLDNTRAA